MCSHYCMNDEPSYSCTCDEGVTLSSNGHNCGGKNIITQSTMYYYYYWGEPELCTDRSSGGGVCIKLNFYI